jgi:bifunctional non-homologous end joining protein LigD
MANSRKAATPDRTPMGTKAGMPKDIEPMLATLVEQPPTTGEWIYEVKWDGYRAVAYVNKGRVEIRSRNNKDFTQKYYPIAAALQAWSASAVLDGELVVLTPAGHPDFGGLQNWRSEADGHLAYYAFDLLWQDGRDLMGLPLKERRQLLRNLLRSAPKNGSIRFSDDFPVSGADLLSVAQKNGLEGIMAKRADSVYAPGYRSREWLKVKTEKHQEAVIGGYTINEGTNKSFSSLLLGVPRDGRLDFLTPVGTGFSAKFQKELLARLKPLRTKTCPFSVVPDVSKPSRFRPDPPKAAVVWVEPRLVAEISYRELTRDGNVRHPAFKGLREDKNAKDVVMEVPQPLPTVRKTPKKSGTSTTRKKVLPLVAPPEAMAGRTLLNPNEETQTRPVNGHMLSFSNLGKPYWPKEKVTKRDMLNYYAQIAGVMLPYYKDKPQTLNRYPNGITGKAFYQKDVKGKVPGWVKTYPYYSEADAREKEFMVVTDEASILYIASLGCIEINPWSSRVKTPDNPDWCILDLDPDRNTFDQVIQAAQVTRRVLEAIGVRSYPKTSGSTGIHIYIPLGAKYDYEASKEFARMIATQVHLELPKTTSIERLIANRKGRMYIDFLQNRPQATVAGPYSLRPKPGAPVSMPLEWEEVKKGLRITDFHIGNAVARIGEAGDLFTPVLGKGTDLKKAWAAAQRVFGVKSRAVVR